jgi:hypothetical protein
MILQEPIRDEVARPPRLEAVGGLAERPTVAGVEGSGRNTVYASIGLPSPAQPANTRRRAKMNRQLQHRETLAGALWYVGAQLTQVAECTWTISASLTAVTKALVTHTHRWQL